MWPQLRDDLAQRDFSSAAAAPYKSLAKENKLDIAVSVNAFLK